jgi:hypothetical protein
MPILSLRDIQISARQESVRMQHFYLGVEHLFVSMLTLDGVTRALMQQRGLTPEYVIEAVRRRLGKGSQQRTFAGMPYTPRTESVMSIASDLMLERGAREINEIDLLTALLEEGDSLPVRVLRQLGIDVADLRQAARTGDTDERPAALGAVPQIAFSERYQANIPLSAEHYRLLRKMFYGCSQILIERQLLGGYSGALILVVTPVGADELRDAPCVVKIDRSDIIMDEAQRYDSQVRASLPAFTARLEDTPTTVSPELAALRYTLVSADAGEPQDLRMAAAALGPSRVAALIRDELYPNFGKTWWMQRKPYRFTVWTEYDWLLPPLLTLEATKTAAPDAVVLRDPVRRDRFSGLDYGVPVIVENFSVHRVDRDRHTLSLSIGRGGESARRAYRVEFRDLDMDQEAHFRGEVIDRITGKLWKTRDDLLATAISELAPDFDLRAAALPGAGRYLTLPNPLQRYHALLDRQVDGSLSKLHGDLHLGNILVGHRGITFLIDFAQARSGHTLFDWACLEVSLLDRMVMPAFGEDWQAARAAISAVDGLENSTPGGSSPLAPTAAVREIVSANLATFGRWLEYDLALAFCGLRAATWETMSPGGRRAAFLLSALAMANIEGSGRSSGDPTTSDRTDIYPQPS